MSRANVELVRRSWTAWLNGDLDGLFERYWAEEVVWDLTHFPDWPDRIYRGADGVREFLSEWLVIWAEYEAGVDDIIGLEDERVLSLAWQRGVGRQSGLKMDMKWAQIGTITDGRVVHVENFLERADAFAAAGIPAPE